MGSRAWDRMGITSFQALQAPFLVTDYELLGRIATGPPAERMLAGLEGHGFVGLGLVPEHLRYAFGVREPLASVGDFAGSRVRVRPSGATDALMRALGAEPVHISGDDVAAAVADGEIDGAEASLGTNCRDEGENHLTVNLPLFPKTLTLFAGQDAYDQLDAGQREAIRTAARQTAAYAAAHPPSEEALMREFCGGGRLVSAVAATAGDLRALERAAQPVYTELEEDASTKALIAAIRALKAASSGHPVAVPPAACAHTARTVSGRRRSPSAVNGTYHWQVTEAGAHAAARAVGAAPDADDGDIGTVGKMTLRDGKWLMGDVEPRTTRAATRSSAAGSCSPGEATSWPSGSVATAAVRSQLEPLPPMDPGDAVVMAGGPWRRVGRRCARSMTRGHVAPTRSGSSTDSRVPPPAGLSSSNRPPSAATRSARPASPLPSPGTAPPTPSSAISTSSRSARSPIEITTLEACAYFATFASASEQMK